MAVFAAIFAMVAVAVGLIASISFDTPGGPSIVLVLAAIFTATMVPTLRRGWR